MIIVSFKSLREWYLFSASTEPAQITSTVMPVLTNSSTQNDEENKGDFEYTFQ